MEKAGELGREKADNILIILVLEHFLMLSACNQVIYFILVAMFNLLFGAGMWQWEISASGVLLMDN